MSLDLARRPRATTRMLLLTLPAVAAATALAAGIDPSRRALSTLPPSGWPAPPEPAAGRLRAAAAGRDRPAEVRAVVVGFRDRGRWVTRVYDGSSPPPEVAALLDVLGR